MNKEETNGIDVLSDAPELLSLMVSQLFAKLRHAQYENSRLRGLYVEANNELTRIIEARGETGRARSKKTKAKKS